VFETDVESLHEDGVRCVVNLCEEWREHEALYVKKGMHEVYVPTLDHHAPPASECERASVAMQKVLDSGDKVYVHCKAGRGRSNAIVLYHLIKTTGGRPEIVQNEIKAKRWHISKKWQSEPIQHLWRDIMGHDDDGSIAAGKKAKAPQAVELPSNLSATDIEEAPLLGSVKPSAKVEKAD